MFFDQFIAKIARKAATPVLGAVDDVVKDAAGLVGKAGGYVVDKLSDAKGAVADYYYDQKNDKTPTDLTSIKGITSAAQKAISVNVLEDVKKGVDVAQKTGDILLRLAVAAEEKVISPAITRPISTLGLVTDVSSPLYAPGKYEQGFQLADIRRAYNRSEEISLGVSLTQSDLIPGFKGFSDKVLNAGGVDIANINLWDDQNVQKNFSDNVVGRYFTGLTDFVGANAALLGVGKVISTAGRAASRSAGLSARGTTLAKFEQDANDGILNIVTNGERGRFTNTAQEINQVAESTDINLIFDFVKKYSNNERLIPLLQDTTDPAMVRDFLLADKGYLPALERLAKSAPDDLAELADLPGYIRSRNLLNDDVYQPTAEALPRIKSAFESSIKKNPENSKIYDAFLDPEGNILSMGKTGVFPIEPKFATAKISGAITGSRAAKAQVRTRDFSGMGYISERTISNRAGGLTASLVKFGGTHKPLGFVTFSGARPFDGIVELNAAFDDIKLFSNGSNLINVGRNEAITAAEYRSKVLADFTSARNPLERRKVLDDLDKAIIHDIARSYEFYDSKIIGELQQIMRQRANRATEQFGRNGFGMDATGRGIFTDAQTQSHIAESYRMSPLRDIEREILRAQKGTLAGKFDSTSAGLNNIYETLTKYWTFDVLARPSYIMKQSWLEPILSSGISQGTKYVFDQVPSMTKNILKNNRNRIKSIAFNTVNAKQAKEVGDVVDSITKQLSEAVQQRELLSAESYKFFETDLVSPKMRKDYGDIVKAELKRADKLVEDLEIELQDAAAVFGGAEEIPSIATLERRIAYIESTQGKIDDIVPGVNPAKITEIDEENFVRAANPNIYNTGYVGLVDVNFVKRFIEFDRTKDVGKGGSGIPGWSAEQIDKITNDLKQGKGFTDHLILDYWLDEDGKLLLKLVEGNHRIQAAIAAGLDFVPVRVMRGSLSRVDEAKPTGIKSKILPNQHDYIPGQVFPGDILPDEFVKTARQAAAAAKPLDKKALFRAKNAAAIVNAKAAINKAKGELNTLIPDAAALTAVYDEIAELYTKIDDVILKDLGKSKLEQAKLFERSADFKKRYYGKGSSYQFIGNQYVKIDELFDENQLGAALREEFANSRSVATTFAGELTVGTKNSILLRRGPRTITDVRDPLYFEELAYVANRTLRNDPLVKLVLQERSLEDIMDWALSTPGQKYFSQFGDFAEGQIPSMVRNRVGLVQRYLPDMRVRAMVLEREVTSIELQKILSEDLGRLSTLHPIDFDYDMVSEAVGAKGLAAVEAAADKAMGAVWSKLTSPENPIRWSFADKVFKDTVARKAQVLADQGVELTVSRMNALRAAATRESLQETEKTFYTIRRKNRALWASRVLTAFPAASLNAMYRYGRFAIKNPTRMAGFLHNYQSTFRSFGVDEYGNPVDDPRKAKFLLIPGTKELGFNDGKGVMLNARSLGFLVNLPAPSYISTIPMTVVYKNKPDAEETFRNILGPTYDAIFPYGAPTNVLSPLMPAWAKDLYKSITGPEGDAQFMATVKSVANYHNALSDMGLKEKLTQEQIFNEARGLYFQRFRAGFASPFGVPYKVETNPMGLFDSYYNILVTKYINKNMNRSDAMDAADMEFLATVAPNFPIDRVAYRGSTAVTYVPATAEGYKRIWKENGKLIDSIGAIGKDGSMIGLLTLDIDATKEDTSLSIYNFLKNPATRLPDGSPLNKYALSPEKEEQRRQINRVWEKYTDLRDRLDAAAQERFKKPLRRIPELSKALSDYADTELKAESLDWWKEKKGQLAGGADNSFNYARALYEITNDKQFMKKYGDSPVWQDAQKFTQIRNAITFAYQSLPTGDPRKSRLKESYLDYIAANLGTFHPKVQEIMKRYFDDDTMKVVTD